MGIDSLRRVPTGISGFDDVALGGLPAGRSTLVTGTAGSGKSLFAMQFLTRGIEAFDEPGVFVTFEETPDDIRVNAAGMGCDIAKWEREGMWSFVDASLTTVEHAPTVGAYDFGPLIARIEHAVRTIGAKRVVLDPLSAVLARFTEVGIVRAELLRVVNALAQLGVVSVLTAEKDLEYGIGSRHGVEEFVPSNLVTLRNVLVREQRRRTVEVVKFRGAVHRTGEWLFAIDPHEGIVVVPLAFAADRQTASHVRISSGNPELDMMCGGGFFRDALVLLTGPSGAGKTLSSLTFTAAGVEAGERCLLCTFDETRDQLGRNAAGWGIDLDAMEASGLLQVMAQSPESSSMEDHFLHLWSATNRFRPARVVIDALSALERIATPRALLDFVTAVGGMLRQGEVTTLLTATPARRQALPDAPSAAVEAASLTDVTIELQYYGSGGRNRRAISILQTRGSAHDESIRRFIIDETGMHIGEPDSSAEPDLSPVPHPRDRERDG